VIVMGEEVDGSLVRPSDRDRQTVQKQLLRPLDKGLR